MESLPSAGCSQGGHRGFQEESDKEGEANILDVDPEVFPLFAEEDIVKNCPGNNNKRLAIASCNLHTGKFRGIYSWAKSLQMIGSFLSSPEGQSIWPRHWELVV